MASDHGNDGEDELEREFRASPRRGLEYLNKHFRRNIFALLKSRSPYSEPAELADLFQETMRRMVKAADQQRFDPRQPMRLVQDIAEKVAVDAYRKKIPVPIGDSSKIETLLCAKLKKTRVAQKWASIDPEDMQKALRLIDETISELPRMQQIAATAIRSVIEEVDESGSWEPLRRRMEEITGDEISADQVGAFQARSLLALKAADGFRRRFPIRHLIPAHRQKAYPLLRHRRLRVRRAVVIHCTRLRRLERLLKRFSDPIYVVIDAARLAHPATSKALSYP